MGDNEPREEAEAPAPKTTGFLHPDGTLPEDHWAQVRSGYPIMFVFYALFSPSSSPNALLHLGVCRDR